MSDAKLRAARGAARRMAKRAGRRDWREFLGAAYERVAPMPDDTPAAHLLRAAVFGTIDHARQELRYGARYGALATDPADCTRPDPQRAAAALWSEYAPLRERWPMRTRVLLYCWAVEGMTLGELAQLYGVTDSALRAHLKLYVPLIDLRKPKR